MTEHRLTFEDRDARLKAEILPTYGDYNDWYHAACSCGTLFAARTEDVLRRETEYHRMGDRA